MLKIHKGLKKKKKDKKHKKESEIFSEEQLEQYRREHKQLEATAISDPVASGSSQSDEWKKFQALTAGVDNVLKKTQGDLDRIKSTSFFQRKPPAVEETDKHQKEETEGVDDISGKDSLKPEEKLTEVEDKEGIVETENEESEFEEEEDIFDTSYVDAVARGEVKLAVIPDSPIEEDTGFDPFDTSIADKFLETNPKKRYLNLGCAVEVLSGKVAEEAARQQALEKKKSVRRRPKPVDLLLTSFDEADTTPSVADSPKKTLLDEDPIFIPTETIHLNTPVPEFFPNFAPQVQEQKVAPKQESLESLEDEFEKLASESLANKSVAEPQSLPVSHLELQSNSNPAKFELDPNFARVEYSGEEKTDPFKNTSSGQSSVPNENHLSKRALSSDDDFDPRAGESDTNPNPNSISAFLNDTLNPESSKILTPSSFNEDLDDAFIDPFDTSKVTIAPGRGELKLIERELVNSTGVIEDQDFDPRGNNQRHSSSSSVIDNLLEEHNKKTLKQSDILTGGRENIDLALHTPVEPSILSLSSPEVEDIDPFDTSFADNIKIGKAEFKVLEDVLK